MKDGDYWLDTSINAIKVYTIIGNTWQAPRLADLHFSGSTITPPSSTNLTLAVSSTNQVIVSGGISATGDYVIGVGKKLVYATNAYLTPEDNITGAVIAGTTSARVKVAGADVGVFTSAGLAVTGASKASQEISVSGSSANWAAADRALVDWNSASSAMRLVAARSGSNSSNMQFVTYNAGTGNINATIDSSGNLSVMNSNLILPKTINTGIMVDTTTPTWGWRDIVGDIIIRGTTGGSPPVYSAWYGGIDQYKFSVGNEADIVFHVPNDYVPGSDMYIHCHWTLAVGSITETVTWSATVTTAKGFNQASFPAPITVGVSQVSSTTAYRHMIAATQLSSNGGSSGTLLNSANIEIESLIIVKIALSANTGSTGPFLHCVDIQYQSTNIGTKSKAPNFYV